MKRKFVAWLLGIAVVLAAVLGSNKSQNSIKPTSENTNSTTPTQHKTSTPATTTPASPAPTQTTQAQEQPSPKANSQSNCDPNYSGACVPIASDVDCVGGSGNGPAYVKGPVKVIGTDIYGLDRDGNGTGCE